MATRKLTATLPAIRQWADLGEVDRAISKLKRRIHDVDALDIGADYLNDGAERDVVEQNVRETIRELFGQASPEFVELQYLSMSPGAFSMDSSDREMIHEYKKGQIRVATTLRGLIGRLEEKKEDLAADSSPKKFSLDANLLHARISSVASELFDDGHHFEAVFAASKALVNYVKERSGKHELDGVNLMRTVFSKNKPILSINNLLDATDQDEQEGMMHLFEGVVMAIRNPGGHAFPEGSERRAAEYLNLISLLAFKVQEARKIKPD